MKHLLSVADLGARRASTDLLGLTDTFVEVSRRAHPQGAGAAGQAPWPRSSTRTRPAPGSSFETAAKRLSADTMNFSVSPSSVKKGESLRDTVETIEAMGVDAIVVRHASLGRARSRSPGGSTPR